MALTLWRQLWRLLWGQPTQQAAVVADENEQGLDVADVASADQVGESPTLSVDAAAVALTPHGLKPALAHSCRQRLPWPSSRTLAARGQWMLLGHSLVCQPGRK